MHAMSSLMEEPIKCLQAQNLEKAQIKVNKTKITLGWLGFPIMILLEPFL
jgi:hypothetical protein